MKVSIKQMQLVSQLSHELRTPISAIIGWNELLMEDELLNSNQKKNMGHIHYASVHLLDLLNTILDVSKLGANKMQLQISSFNLHDLVFTVAEMLVGSTIESNIELLVDYHRNIPHNFFGDPGRIRQILINLLSNAIKFTSSGGEVKVVVRCLASTPKKSYIEIRVEDTGCGIPIELHSLLFREFVQVGVNDAKSPKLGTGLGLYLVKNLTTMMEGKVWVKSMPNIGSIFGVRLPLALQSESINISEKQASINSASSGKNKKELDISLSDLEDYEDHNVADAPLFSCNLPNSKEYLKSATLNAPNQQSLKTLHKDDLNDSDSSDSALELFKAKKNLASMSDNKIKLFSSPELLTENLDCRISLQTLNFLSSTEFVIVGSSKRFSQFLNNMCKNNWNSRTTQIVDLVKSQEGDSHINANAINRLNMHEPTNITPPYEVVSLKKSIPTFMIDMTESINNVQWEDSQESMDLRLKIKDELSNIYNSYTSDTGVYDDLHSSLLSISEWLVVAAEMNSPFFLGSKDFSSSVFEGNLASQNHIFLNPASKSNIFYLSEDNSDKLQLKTSNNLEHEPYSTLNGKSLTSDAKVLKHHSSKRNPRYKIKNKHSTKSNHHEISKSRSESISLKEFVISVRKISKTISLSRYFNNHSKIPYEDLRHQSFSQTNLKNSIPQHTDPIENGLCPKTLQNYRNLNEKSYSGIFSTYKGPQNNNTSVDLVRPNSNPSRKYSYDELSLSEKSAQFNGLKGGYSYIPPARQPAIKNFNRSSRNENSSKLFQSIKGVSAMTSLELGYENSLNQNNNIKNIFLEYENDISTSKYRGSKKKNKKSCSVDFFSSGSMIKNPINKSLRKKRSKSIDLTKKPNFKNIYHSSDLIGESLGQSSHGLDKSLSQNSALAYKFEPNPNPNPKLVSIRNTIPEKDNFQKVASNGHLSHDKPADTSSQLNALNSYLYKVENFPTKTPKLSIVEIKNKINLKKSISKNLTENLNKFRLQSHVSNNEVTQPNELFLNIQSDCSSSTKAIADKKNLKSIPNTGSENKIAVCSFFIKKKSNIIGSYKSLIDIENREINPFQGLNTSNLKALDCGNAFIDEFKSRNNKKNRGSSIIRPIESVSIAQKGFNTTKPDKVISKNENLLTPYRPDARNIVPYEIFRNFCIRQRDDSLCKFDRCMFETYLSVDLSYISNRFSFNFKPTLQRPTEASYQGKKYLKDLPNFRTFYLHEKNNKNSIDIRLKNQTKMLEPLNSSSYIYGVVMTEYLSNVILKYKRSLASISLNIENSRTVSSKTDNGILKKSTSKLNLKSDSVHLSFPTHNYIACKMLTPDNSNSHNSLVSNQLLAQKNEMSSCKKILDNQLFSRKLDSKSFPNITMLHNKSISNDEESLKFLDKILFEHSNSESKIFGKIDFLNSYDSNQSNSSFSNEYLEKKNQKISSDVAKSSLNCSNVNGANSIDFLEGSNEPFSSSLNNSNSLFSHNIDIQLTCSNPSCLNYRSIPEFSEVREIQYEDYKNFHKSEIDKPIISCHDLNFSNRNISDSVSKFSVAGHDVFDKISYKNFIDTLPSKVLNHKKTYDDGNFHYRSTLNKNSQTSIESSAFKSTQPLSNSYPTAFLKSKPIQKVNHPSKLNTSLFEIPKYKNPTDYYNKPRKNLSFSTFPSKENIYSSLMNSNVLVDKDNFHNSYNKQFQIYEPSNLKSSDLILGKSSKSSPRVLVADDSSPNRMLLVSQLKKLGITNIDSASDGIAACNLFKPGKYYLIFMDIQMPQVDGYQATSYIRKVEKDQLNRLDGDATDVSKINFSNSAQLLTTSSKNGEKTRIISKGRILTNQKNDYSHKNTRKSVNNSKSLISSDNLGLVQGGSCKPTNTNNGANNFSRSIILALSADTSVKELFNSNSNKGTMGFDSVYSKPISLKDLYTTISFWLPWYEFPESILKKFSEND
ncbi:Hybrid signal transduction histidine kinase K [Smittium culicis]|uniref:histidine kinase n=1 Tax=Smittium culicis TaxID=133412 RepID=A0A1R1XVT0_9FUNG|nr:Hybrid signal transduction histidine kinase K [Smittium culicis]